MTEQPAMPAYVAQAAKDIQQFRETPVTFELDLVTAMDLLGLIQLASRHPALPERTLKFAKHFGGYVQKAVSMTPALAQLAAAGWKPEFDMPPDERTDQNARAN